MWLRFGVGEDGSGDLGDGVELGRGEPVETEDAEPPVGLIAPSLPGPPRRPGPSHAVRSAPEGFDDGGHVVVAVGCFGVPEQGADRGRKLQGHAGRGGSLGDEVHVLGE